MADLKPTIAEALSRVMAEVQSVGKNKRNEQQGYLFRGIDAVVNAVGPAFRAHGVICLPLVEDVAYQVVEVGKQRTLMRECTVRVRYTFHGPAGDSLECVSVGEAMDSGDKSTPKAMSVAYRVALLQALCIPTDEPDADAQTFERAPRQQEPVWDPAEQELLLTAWSEEISKAKTGDEIATIGKQILAGKQKAEISPNTYQKLARAGAARKAELNGGGHAQPADATAGV